MNSLKVQYWAEVTCHGDIARQEASKPALALLYLETEETKAGLDESCLKRAFSTVGRYICPILYIRFVKLSNVYAECDERVNERTVAVRSAGSAYNDVVVAYRCE